MVLVPQCVGLEMDGNMPMDLNAHVLKDMQDMFVRTMGVRVTIEGSFLWSVYYYKTLLSISVNH